MEQNQAISDILETVTFIKDNAITREEFTELKQEVLGLKQDITVVKATMVTKDYLDDKLADLKGDIVVKQRKIEGRIDTLVTMLQNRNLLASSDVKLLSDLRVFPHIGE